MDSFKYCLYFGVVFICLFWFCGIFLALDIVLDVSIKQCFMFSYVLYKLTYCS